MKRKPSPYALPMEPRKRLSKKRRAQLFLERGGRCHRCRGKIEAGSRWIAEHYIALQLGGTNEWSNLELTCNSCFFAKNTEDQKKATKGRKIRKREHEHKTYMENRLMPVDVRGNLADAQASPSKACRKCGSTKPLSEYHPHSQMRDGRHSWCKECTKANQRLWRSKNLEHSLQYGREWHASNLDHVRELQRTRYEKDIESGRKRAREQQRKRDSAAKIRRQKLYCQRHPEKVKAQKKVQWAIGKRILKRKPCEVCGENNTQAHHHDYSKPLDVRWLCSPCHGDEHRRLNALERGKA